MKEEKISELNPFSTTSQENGRRKFIETGFKIALVSGISGVSFFSCKKEEQENKKEEESDEKEVSPPEDLMQEHGILNRILLIYDYSKVQLINKKSFPIEALAGSAAIVRTFIEDYHEKQEENYLFPRFERANILTDLVKTLRTQHDAGRKITDQIIQLTMQATRNDSENKKLVALITAFNTMYRPHEAREDTVLFPAFRKLVSKHEYDSLGEEFENNEHKMFGEDGFEKTVEKIAGIEKQLGIYELNQFTPKI